ncbi:MAG: spirocyclase AveC family protein [Pseudomonadota bacterium]
MVRTHSNTLAAAHILALWGAILLVAQVYTWAGFFAHGPVSVEPEGPFLPATYWGARFFEVTGWLSLLALAPIVIRRCIAENRLTFDAKFCIAGLLTYWCDPMVEFFQPIFFNSAYYVNVRDWTGFIPFIVNPDAGHILEPYLAYIPMYTSGFLAYAMMLNALMHKLSDRVPNVSGYTLFAIAFAVGALLEIAVEIIWLKLELISYPGAPDFMALYVGDLKMPWIEWFTGGLVFGSFSLVRYYVDQDGLRITERGLSNLSSKMQAMVSTLAMIAILNSLMITASLMDAFVGLYSSPWRPQPAHLLIGACDLPGSYTGSRYGPCPGSEGYRMPLHGSLEGPNPHGRK